MVRKGTGSREERRKERYTQLRKLGFTPAEARRFRDTSFFTRKETQSYSLPERRRIYDLGPEYRRDAIAVGNLRSESIQADRAAKKERWSQFSSSTRRTPEDEKDFGTLADIIGKNMLKSGVNPKYVERNKYRFANKWYVDRGFEVDELRFAGSAFRSEEIYYNEDDDLTE